MTKFTAFKNNLFVTMNFDNNGMPYRVITKNPKQPNDILSDRIK